MTILTSKVGTVNAVRGEGALEHIARWQTVATLENPGSPLDGATEMSVHAWHGPPGADREPQVEPASENSGETSMAYRDGRAPRFAVCLRNRTEQALFFALLGLDEVAFSFWG